MGMIAGLRAEADKEAQGALKNLVAYMVKNPGKRNALLEDTYRAAERVLDAIDEYETHLAAATQDADPEAPDYFTILTESELRLMDGNR